MNRLTQHLLLFLFTLCIQTQALAQEKQYRFHNHTNNLPESWVDDIEQDHKGLLWLVNGGENICVYDGNSFRKLGNANSYLKPLLDCNYSSVEEDGNGNLWLGSNNGLWKVTLKTEKVHHFLNNPADPNSLSNNNISDLFIDVEKNLWIGTDGGGLNKLDTLGNYTRYLNSEENEGSISNNNIVSIDQDLAGDIWVNTYKGLDKLNTKTSEFTHYYGRLISEEGNPIEEMNEVLVDSEGIIWAASRNKGLFSINPKTDAIRSYFPNPDSQGAINSVKVYSLEEDVHGNIWVGTWGFGINIYNKKTDSFTAIISDKNNSFSLPSNVVTKLFKDKDNHMWIGTAYDGLFLYDPKEEKFIWHQNIANNPRTISGDKVRAIAASKNGDLWVGAFQGGLNRVDSERGNIDVFRGDPTVASKGFNSQSIWALHADLDNNVWAGSPEGLYKYDSIRSSFIKYSTTANTPTNWKSNMVYSLTGDRFGNIWVGSWYDGLKKFIPSENKVELYFQEDLEKPVTSSFRATRSLMVDSKDNLWVGSYVGIAKINILTNDVEYYEYDSLNENSIPGNNVPTLFEDNTGKIWVGTQRGLCYYQAASNNFKRVSISEDNVEPKVDGIIQDATHNYWIATQNRGLISLSENLETIRTYDDADGIPYLEFNERASLVRKNGNIMFATDRGILEFNPLDLSLDSTHYPLVTSSYLLNNKKISISENERLTVAPQYLDNVTLDYTDNIFGFEFSSLRYNKADKVKYAYMLENHSDEWVETDHENRRVNFINIPPGKYVFKVKAANEIGEWGNELAINIKIYPPWWLTDLAKTIWFLLLIGLLFGIYLFRTRALRNQKIKLEQEVKMQTNELNEINKELVHQKESIENQAKSLIDKNNEVAQQKEEIEIQKEELLITNEKLIELNNFKQSMTGMIVHDLKNPLNVILGLTEGEFNLKNQKRLNQSGKVMLNLVTNIIEVQKLEETVPQLVLESINLKSVVESTIGNVLILAEEKNLKIQYTVNDSIQVLAEKDLLERVIINLLTNAIKYTPQNGEVMITYSTDEVKYKNQVVISVTDTGKGIPKASQRNIFEKYVQIDMKKSGRTRSTGLGLTFCKLAIEAHGGVIGITSEENNGATFWFTMNLDGDVKERMDREVSETLSKHSVKFSFSKQDIDLLIPFVTKLETHEVYDLSEIKSILKEISKTATTPIVEWISAIEDTLYASNEEQFKELLKIEEIL